MAELAVANHNGPNPEDLKEKRRRIVRAYGDGGYSDQEYKIRLAEIDRQIEQTTFITPPDIEDAVELFDNLPLLWNEATTEERKTLIKSLVELVYVDLKTKQVTALKPTPAFRALFGKGIDAGANTPIELHALNRDIVGVGGDGGGFNSHNSKQLLRSTETKYPFLNNIPSLNLHTLPSDVIYVEWLEAPDKRNRATKSISRKPFNIPVLFWFI